MKFDKTKVYTALNATEDLIGAKGYFANDLYDIICNCENELLHTYGKVIKVSKYVINGIQEDEIGVKWNCNFNFFYLVEPALEKWYVFERSDGSYSAPENRISALYKIAFTGSKKECYEWIEEHTVTLSDIGLEDKPKYRPFKDCDELANYSESLHQRTHKFRVDLDMPFIWVKNKNVYTKHLIIDFGDNFCSISHPARNELKGLTLEELFENYTFLDGSVCGVIND